MNVISTPAPCASVDAPPHGRAWLHFLLIAALMFSRRPDALLHPQFWAEDGKIFYHDAYMKGWPSLWHPFGGYLNTLSRLGALLAVQFPLSFAPAIYAAIALTFQLAPVALMLSRRMQEALPSWAARLTMIYFYVAVPNSYEININLTNAQWHLAILAFLLVVSTPPVGRAARALDIVLLTLSGLSGPFGIFLIPIAWFEIWQSRATARLANTLAVTIAAAVQLGLILASHAARGRLATPLGATPISFIKIITYQIVFGGLLGYHMTVAFLTLPVWHSVVNLAAALSAAACLVGVALWLGPPIYRKAAFWAAALFGAALITPLSSVSIPQWTEMTHPGASIRYYVVPTLVWFATIVIIARSQWVLLRLIGYLLLTATVIGIHYEWLYPSFDSTDFYPKAAAFAAAAPGTSFIFAENPPSWAMTLIKHE